jgi:phosphoglycolate phosphatase
MPEVLRQIAKESIVVVNTFNLQEEVLEVLSAHGVEDCVSLIFDGADPRPKSERIRWALEHFQVDRKEAYMVGDARSDIREGRAAGVRTVAVTWGYQPREALVAEEPDFVADRPEDLPAILREQ